MNLKFQDRVTTVALFIGTTFSSWCRCFGKPFDIMALGNFSVNNWVFSENVGVLKWSVQLKYSCLFKHDIGGTALQCISHHDVPKSAKNFQVFFLFPPLWHYHTKGHMSVNNQAISSWSLLFSRLPLSCRKMSGTLLQTGRGMVVGGGLKRQEKNKTQATENKAQLALSGTILHPHISWAWHLLASMENDCRWKLKANDLMTILAANLDFLQVI